MKLCERDPNSSPAAGRFGYNLLPAPRCVMSRGLRARRRPRPLLGSKNADGRVLTLDGPLADLMARRWRARVLPASGDRTEVADLVFHRDGEPIRDFGKAWASACAAVGWPG